MRVLLYGKDARTVALANACEESPDAPELFACSEFRVPGLLENPADIHVVSLRDLEGMVRYAREVDPHLAIIGPEEPLSVGLVDALEAMGIPCFGPRRDPARIETSKGWARDLLAKHGIPGLPEYRVFTSANSLGDYLAHLGEFVVKPDGLTGGKGVKVFGEHLSSVAEAVEYATALLGRQPVVVERRLQGEEFSLQSVTDGQTVVHCPVVQDHKRAYDGDTGPNTGGMGSYSCPDFSLPFLEQKDVDEAKRINEAVVEAIQSETNTTYRGVLYGGFIATRDGVFVIEYNARFGDPEALNVLPLLETNFLEIGEAVARGGLHRIHVRFASKATVCKYVVPQGYPDAGKREATIEVDLELVKECGARAYFAAVNEQDGKKHLTGSRAVAIVGIGSNTSEAERSAERATGAVMGPVWHRRDIGTDALIRTRVDHMRALRGGSSAHVFRSGPGAGRTAPGA